MNENTKMGDHSILWGYAIDVWDTWGYRLMIAGAAFGAVALVVSLISSIILYKVAAVSQIELQEKTGQLEVTLKTQERLTAEARTEANKSAVELEKIKRQVAPRILSEDQQEQLYKSLLPFGRLAMAQGRPKVVLISYGMDTEGAVLGSQLLTILERAGLEAVNMLASEVPMGSFAVGVHIAGANNNLTFALFEGIGESGIEVTLGTKLPSLNPEYRTPDMPAAVLIGTRPVRVPQK